MAEARVALVTGASGDLGAAIARCFHARGYALALFDRDAESANRAASQFQERATGFAVDQVRRDQVEQGIAAVLNRFGGIDVAVANAGYAKFGGFLDMEPRTWNRHVDVNLTGTFHVCQLAARAMADRRAGGSIVVTASSLALAHADGVGAYCATKAALLMLVRTMAAELGVYGIRANAVLPGVIESGMTCMLLDQPGVRDDLRQLTPAGRLGTPEDVANAVDFLCADEAGFVTGAALSVDGGQSIYGQPRWVRQDRSRPHEPQWVAGLGKIETNF